MTYWNLFSGLVKLGVKGEGDILFLFLSWIEYPDTTPSVFYKIYFSIYHGLCLISWVIYYICKIKSFKNIISTITPYFTHFIPLFPSGKLKQITYTFLYDRGSKTKS